MKPSQYIVTECEQCHEPFSYKRSKSPCPRKKCNRCKKQNAAACKKQNATDKAQQRSESLAGFARRGKMVAPAQMTYEEVALALGVKRKAVEDGELSALLKLRKHPELLASWCDARRDGFPALEPRPSRARRLLEMQSAMMEWWETHARLLAAGETAAAAEVERLIGEFHQRLQAELMK